MQLQFSFFFNFLVMQLQFQNFPNYLIMQLQFFLPELILHEYSVEGYSSHEQHDMGRNKRIKKWIPWTLIL